MYRIWFQNKFIFKKIETRQVRITKKDKNSATRCLYVYSRIYLFRSERSGIIYLLRIFSVTYYERGENDNNLRVNQENCQKNSAAIWSYVSLFRGSWKTKKSCEHHNFICVVLWPLMLLKIKILQLITDNFDEIKWWTEDSLNVKRC